MRCFGIVETQKHIKFDQKNKSKNETLKELLHLIWYIPIYVYI